ncbi:MAG TPA: hypothetical protein VHY08_15890 [Bacillota bacterium]|nr:hypothetical protein [Bacillota bacterium]
MRPLLIVHGINSNARSTYGAPGKFSKKGRSKSMFTFLESIGYKAGQDLFWYSYQTRRPISISMNILKAQITKTLQLTHSTEVDLLTFSLGGIISKYYLISPCYQNEVKRLIMIAPPFLGSHRADWIQTLFPQRKEVSLHEGVAKLWTPQILSYHHPVLMQLAKIPFPKDVTTTIIAMKQEIAEQGLISIYLRALTRWVGEGDLTVPLESTKIDVDYHLEIHEEFSRKAIHGFLPDNPGVQHYVAQQLGLAL